MWVSRYRNVYQAVLQSWSNARNRKNDGLAWTRVQESKSPFRRGFGFYSGAPHKLYLLGGLALLTQLILVEYAELACPVSCASCTANYGNSEFRRSNVKHVVNFGASFTGATLIQATVGRQ